MNESPNIGEQRSKRIELTEVVITRSDEGAEYLYVGDITGVSMLQTWEDENGETQHKRFHVVDRVETPKPMSQKEVSEWVKSGPDDLNNKLEHDLPDDLWSGIGITEFHSKSRGA